MHHYWTTQDKLTGKQKHNFKLTSQQKVFWLETRYKNSHRWVNGSYIYIDRVISLPGPKMIIISLKVNKQPKCLLWGNYQCNGDVCVPLLRNGCLHFRSLSQTLLTWLLAFILPPATVSHAKLVNVCWRDLVA